MQRGMVKKTHHGKSEKASRSVGSQKPKRTEIVGCRNVWEREHTKACLGRSQVLKGSDRAEVVGLRDLWKRKLTTAGLGKLPDLGAHMGANRIEMTGLMEVWEREGNPIFINFETYLKVKVIIWLGYMMTANDQNSTTEDRQTSAHIKR